MTIPVATESIIDPDLPIVDAHHHLWFQSEATLAAAEARRSILSLSLLPMYRSRARYLFDEYVADVRSGHNVRSTVFVDCRAMYRQCGPEAFKPVGEIEFANGVAAMGASGLFGEAKICAGIVGGIDLRLGDAVEDILKAYIQAGNGRFRGVRSAGVAHDPDERILGASGVPHLLLDSKFRSGFKWLYRLGLSFDAWLLEPQLPELIDLARAFPATQIILNHVGAPLGVGSYLGKREERFSLWRDHIRKLSECSNVVVKLGGLGIPLGGFQSFMSTPPATSAELAAEWKPYIQTCIEVFGVDRCMFESNFPVDSATCSYAVLWNAFKRLTASASQDEKTALFSGTATRIYRLRT
jgi:L-fuconolactonase